jgi:hypothetical protein
MEFFIKRFADDMQNTYEKHKDKKGDNWKKDIIADLGFRLECELAELKHAVYSFYKYVDDTEDAKDLSIDKLIELSNNIQNEATDVGLFAAFINAKAHWLREDAE